MPRTIPFLLAVGILAISTAAPLIKLIPQVPALVVAAYRLTLAALTLVPIAGIDLCRGKTKLAPRDWIWVAGAGVCLALHFTFWIASLRYTSVASSVVLVTLNPLFLALAGYVLWGERFTLGLGLGIGLALVGSVGVAWHDAQEVGSLQTGSALWGDGLALCGAVLASAYLLLGRLARPRLPLGTYVGMVYALAALFLVGGCFLMGLPLWGYSGETYLLLLLLALIPKVVGHTILNWTLAYLSPTLVALAILGEPVGAKLLAFVFLGESLSWFQALGALLVLEGVARGQRAYPLRGGA